jgi:hypothetical protein
MRLEELASAGCREKRRQAEDVLVGCEQPLIPPNSHCDDGRGEGTLAR